MLSKHGKISPDQSTGQNVSFKMMYHLLDQMYIFSEILPSVCRPPSTCREFKGEQWKAQQRILAPAPSLYKALGTHQRSKNHKIRGYYEGNSHVLEVVKRGVFFAYKSVILEIRGTIQPIEAS